jgi:hypothetical protein
MTQIDENALEAAIEQLFDNSEEDTWRCRGRKMITAYLEALPPTGDAMELVAVIGKHLKGRDVGCTSDELHCRAADALTAAAARIDKHYAALPPTGDVGLREAIDDCEESRKQRDVRDRFLVQRGLWGEFCKWLPDELPPVSAEARIAELERERDKARDLNERLRREAEMWAGEARCHKATVHECYQIATGGKGEPGNWNGAKPIREAFAAATARAERLEAALRDAREAWSRYEKFLELIGTATDIERAYNDVCTALSPAAPSKGGDGWQDIASAPRDGTPIQIWQEGLEPNQYVAAFDEGWSNSGWWLICDGKNTEIPLRGPAPTYWRHVFDAPTPHKEGK